MDWLKEHFSPEEIEEVLDKDSLLVFQHCALDTLTTLWENLPGINIYVSEKPLNELRRRYVRANPENLTTKELAARIGASERFVQKALATTDEKDDRQGSLL